MAGDNNDHIEDAVIISEEKRPKTELEVLREEMAELRVQNLSMGKTLTTFTASHNQLVREFNHLLAAVNTLPDNAIFVGRLFANMEKMYEEAEAKIDNDRMRSWVPRLVLVPEAEVGPDTKQVWYEQVAGDEADETQRMHLHVSYQTDDGAGNVTWVEDIDADGVKEIIYGAYLKKLMDNKIPPGEKVYLNIDAPPLPDIDAIQEQLQQSELDVTGENHTTLKITQEPTGAEGEVQVVISVQNEPGEQVIAYVRELVDGEWTDIPDGKIPQDLIDMYLKGIAELGGIAGQTWYVSHL